MTARVDFFEDVNHPILPSQYNDLVRRRSPGLDGEYRLLWAVLEGAIKSYLSNRERSTRSQRIALEEVRRWFRPRENKREDLFAFQTICDLLEIDSGRLLKGLKSLDAQKFLPRRHRLLRNAEPRSVAA